MARVFTVYADGGSRGNPGAAAYGAVIMEGDRLIQELSEAIGTSTNNVAEYSGLLAALRAVHLIDPAAEV
ncbi:MAG: hypothetical protein RLZZ394_654, partial [Actinomycetota bacterium]